MYALEERVNGLQEANPFMPMHQIITILIREDILDCRIPPGEKRSEEQWASLYHASRTTIRKAMDALLEEGWLEKDERHKVSISLLHREDYLDLMEYRAVIEPAACRLAARNRDTSDLTRLEEAVEAGNTPDVETLSDSDSRFHLAVFQAAKNPYLIQANELTWQKITRGKIYTRGDYTELYKKSYQEHLAIFKAIREGNEELARRLGQQHIKMMLDSRVIRRQAAGRRAES